jgi:hypothetical protein
MMAGGQIMQSSRAVFQKRIPHIERILFLAIIPSIDHNVCIPL